MYEHFQKLDIRVGKIIDVQDFPEASKSAYKLTIDFGNEIGIKKSSAQLVANYTKNNLQEKLILAIVNLGPKKIGSMISQVLVLGVPDANGETVLIQPDCSVPIGGKLY